MPFCIPVICSVFEQSLRKQMNSSHLDFIFRFGIVCVFFVNGVSKLQNIDGVMGWMESYGFPGAFIFPAIAIELIAPLLILFGIERRFSCLSLMAFCALSALIFHSDFDSAVQITAFLKNIALMSGIYFLMTKKQKPQDAEWDHNRTDKLD